MKHSRTLTGFALFCAALLALPSLGYSHWAYTGALTKAEILAKIIGNTLTGSTSSGSTYADYYTVDGVVHGNDSKTGKYTAKWTVRDDDLMCWAYPPSFNIGGCVLLVLKDNVVKFQLIDGSVEPAATLLTGNPLGL
jgi:hypothetical protein